MAKTFCSELVELFENCVRSAVQQCNYRQRTAASNSQDAPEYVISFAEIEQAAVEEWHRLLDPEGKYEEDRLVTDEQRLAIRVLIANNVVVEYR